jgi:hypothetical protein
MKSREGGFEAVPGAPVRSKPNGKIAQQAIGARCADARAIVKSGEAEGDS